MPDFHAKLSPSSCDRWLVCPGSVVLCDGIPEKSSPYAQEGTDAHALAERILKGNAPPKDTDPEMLRHVLTYVGYVNERYDEAEVRHIERQVKVCDEIWGTADAILWNEKTRTLEVVDLKYGAGVPVEVSNNTQLKTYALAALLTMKYPAKQVVVTIVQPRLPHPDGVIRSKEYDVVDLLEWHADLMDGVKRVGDAIDEYPALSPEVFAREYLVPSEKGCRWCLAAPTCPKVKSKAFEVASQVFAPAMSYDPQVLANTLDQLPLLEGWIKNLREFAYAEAEAGRVPPGYKLVEKRATRKWKDAELVTQKLAEVMPLSDAYEDPKLKSPAQVEKLLDKADRHVLEEITIKESSGHTLVHDSDKRDSIRVDATSVFS